MTRGKRLTIAGLFVWFVAILYYFFEYFLGVFPGTIAQDLMKSLNMTAEQFSLLGSAYYFIYGPMQLPVGLIVDRMGVRLILPLAASLCVLGVFWFSFASSFFPSFISRSMMGLGSSFAFVSILVIALNWFPQKHFGLMAGLTQFLGAIGPLLAGGPLAYVLALVSGDWRLVMRVMGIVGLGIITLIILFVRNKPKSSDQKIIHLNPHRSIRKDFVKLISSRRIWGIILYAAAIYTPLPLMGAFWGTSFLMTKGFSQQLAASITSMIWVGMATGCPILGKFSDSIKRRKLPLIMGATIGLISSGVLLFYSSQNVYLLFFLFFLIGFGGSAQSVTFPTAAETAERQTHAVCLGLNNCFMITMSAIIPPFVSSIIQSNALIVNNQYVYTELSFLKGLISIPILFGLSLLFAIFGIKETFCRQQHEVHKLES